MKKLLLAAAGASALAFAAAPAQSAIYISFNGTTTLVGGFFANDQVDNAFVANCGVVNCGGFDNVNVSTNPSLSPVLLHSETVEANASGAASIDVYVTRTDANDTDFTAFMSGFSGTFGSGSGFAPFQVVYRTYIDPNNGLYSTANLLSTTTLNGAGGFSNPLAYSNQQVAGFGGLTGPYSITTRYTITTTGRASLQPDSIVVGMVPEPTTWALMIGGFGAAGAMLRRRRAASVAA